MRPLLTLLLLSCIHLAYAQLGTSNYTITTQDSVRAFGLEPADDGGLWVLGQIDNSNNNPSGNARDAVVLRLDEAGDIAWSREYDAGSFQYIYNLFPTQDGGFVMGGTTTTEYFNMYAAKADSNGDIEWSVFLGNDGLQRGFDLIETADGGYLVVGHTAALIELSVYVYKLDSNGNTEWAKVYYENAGLNQSGYDVIELPDGGYIIAGENGETFNNEGMLIQLDEEGNVVWARTYDYEDLNSAALSVVPLSNGDLVLLQNSNIISDPIFGGTAFVVSRLTPQGEEVWSRFAAIDDNSVFVQINGFNFGFISSAYSVVVNEEDEILLATSADFDQSDDIRPNLLKLSEDGDLIWAVEFTEEGFLQNPIYQRGSPLAIDASGNYNYIYQDIFDNTGFQIAKVNPQGQGVCADPVLPELQDITLNIQELSLQVADLIASTAFPTTVTEQSFTVDASSGGSIALDLGDDQILCTDSIVLNPGFGATATYLWQDGSTDSTYTVLGPGTYAVTITQDECVAEDSIVIALLESAVVLGEDLEWCEGSTLTLQPESTYEGAYLWNTGDSTSSIQVTEPGTYILELTTICGPIADTIELFTPVLAPFPIVYADSVCQGSSTTASVAPDSSVSISWKNLDGATLENGPGFSLLIDQDTSLIVEATDGCALRMDTISITAIPAPEISLIPGNPSCGDASGFINMEIEGGVPPFLIEWENPEGMLIAGNVTTVINLLSGSYQMTLIDDAGCIFTENILLVDEGTPETTVVVEDINCAGESTGAITVDILGGVAPFNYAWAVDGQAISTNSAVLTDLAPGNYALTFTDADECSLIIEDLILSAPSPLQFDVVVNSPDCPGEASGSINIINISGGTLPYDFRIDGAPFQRDSTFTNLSAGQYELILQDAQGCDTLLQAEVPAANDIDIELTVNQNPASIGESLQFQVLGIELLNPVLAINWQSDPTIALSCLDCTSPTATAIASGHVVVDVITENSCTFTDSLLLTVAKDARIYIPTAFSPNGDGRNDLFEVFPGIGIAKISDFEIYNRWGGLVFQSSVDGAGWDGTINGAPAPAGVYVYLVTVRWLDGMVKQYSGEIQLLR